MARVEIVILVRHAHAGDKAHWHQDDALRPLSEWGLAQAASLVRSLAEDDISVVWSSPAVRCRLTVEPLAAVRGVSVQDHLLLAKDARRAPASLERRRRRWPQRCTRVSVVT